MRIIERSLHCSYLLKIFKKILDEKKNYFDKLTTGLYKISPNYLLSKANLNSNLISF